MSADLGGRHGRARCGDPVPTTCRDPAAQRDQCHPHAARGQDARWAAQGHVSKVVQQEHRSLQGAAGESRPTAGAGTPTTRPPPVADPRAYPDTSCFLLLLLAVGGPFDAQIHSVTRWLRGVLRGLP